MTLPKHRSIEVESHDRLEDETPSILHSQRRKRDRPINRRIGRLYFGWFGGVQLFYSQESEP